MATTDAIPMSSARAADAAKERAHRKKGFFRTNVEAFTVAIVMALVIKQFAFEAFQVPTESMEPTILGRTPGGDRIIVNKFAYEFREPERYDVVVFRYPLSRLVNYVKRLVGLPGEGIKIAHGDIFVRAKGETEFKVARKPASVQEAIFDANPVIPADQLDPIRRSQFWDWWQRPGANAEIDENAGTLALDAGSGEMLVATRPQKVGETRALIRAERRDRDAFDRKGRADIDIDEPSGDLRFSLAVTPQDGAKAVVLRIVDGTQQSQPIRLELSAQEGTASRLQHGSADVSNDALRKLVLARNEKTRITVENVDDRVRVLVDGDEVCVYDYAQALTSPANGQSSVAFGLTGGKARFEDLALARDLQYREWNFPGDPPTPVFEVPDGHYLFFGDNSPNSLDARAFRVVGIRLRADGTVLLGDMEAVADDFDAPRQDNNPYLEVDAHHEVVDRNVHHFRDIQGNHWKLAAGSYDVLDLTALSKDDGYSVLRLHQTKMPEGSGVAMGNGAGAGALSAVSAELLDKLTSGTRHAFKTYSRLVHFVARKEIMGRANVVFLPGGRNLLETVLHLARLRVIR